jgi:signal transduction histidine kinase
VSSQHPPARTRSLPERLLHWLPAEVRAGVLQRGLIVAGVAFAIAVAQWLGSPVQHPFDRSLVYSFAISACIWSLTDPLRIALRRSLQLEGPSYWGTSLRTVAYLICSIVAGYSLGTTLGDLYAGQSTWQLIALSPQRFWGFLMSSAVISLGFIFYFWQRERALDLQRQATEARLKLLESQLEPHMLFNTLANLRALIATDPPRAIHMLDRLNDFLRATLRASRSATGSGAHTLADEFARLADYLELMAVRMGPRLQVSMDLPDALKQHAVPPLLLQPLVENAIRHGLEPQVAGGRIVISARAAGSSLVLEVSDTGAGMLLDAATSTGSTGTGKEGFGLAQVRERVASLPTGRGQVTVQSAVGCGTTVRIQLPLNSQV